MLGALGLGLTDRSLAWVSVAQWSFAGHTDTGPERLQGDTQCRVPHCQALVSGGFSLLGSGVWTTLGM